MIFDIFKSKSKLNCVECTLKLMRLLRVYETEQRLLQKFNAHPNNGTLLSISDILNEYGIQNRCIKIDKANIFSLNKPAIVAIKIEEQSYFTTVIKVNVNDILFYHPVLLRKYSCSADEFNKLWSGVILLTESDKGHKKENFAINIVLEKIRSALIPLIAITLLTIAIKNITLVNKGHEIPIIGVISLFFILILGSVTSFFLITLNTKKDKSILSNICNIKDGFDCNSVTDSRASNIAGIPWSVIGFTYFFSGCIMLSLYDLNNSQTISTLVILNFLSLPYVLFSVYYQWKIVRKWCLLCLFVQFVLIAELFINLYFFRFNWGMRPSIHQIFQTGFIYLSVLISSYYYSLVHKKNIEYRIIENSMIRFRYDKEVFQTILRKQSRLSDKINLDIGLVLGNIHARTEIIKICNPYCQPCLESHASLEQLLKNNRDVRIRIIYNITDDEEDLRSMPVKHFFAIWRETPELLREALIEWYSSKNLNYDIFASKYPLKTSLKLQESEIKKMYKWCVENGLDDRSPVYLIDGYYLPEIYQAKDLQSVL